MLEGKFAALVKLSERGRRLEPSLTSNSAERNPSTITEFSNLVHYEKPSAVFAVRIMRDLPLPTGSHPLSESRNVYGPSSENRKKLRVGHEWLMGNRRGTRLFERIW